MNFRTTVSAIALMGAVCAYSLPAASAMAATIYDIKEQSVTAALQGFAKQSGLQFVYLSKIAQGRTTKGLSGKYTPEAALKELLQGTELYFQFINDGTVAISDQPISKEMLHLNSYAPANTPESAAQKAAAPSTAMPMARATETSLDEIIITARRREESMQDVPVAITAITEAGLFRSGIEGIENLFSRAPSLYLSRTGNSSTEEQLIIRGVGVRSPLEPSVAIFLDDVYVPSFMWRADFVELQQVEILRGPQGALFGRNTEAGAINLTSKKPQMDEFSGKVKFNADSLNSVGASLYVSGPISDTVAFSLASSARTTDGYVKNLNTGTDSLSRSSQGHRLSLRIEPDSNLSIDASFDYTKNEGGPEAGGSRTIGSSDPANQPGEYETTRKFNSYEEFESFGASLRVQYDFETFNLKSITAYRTAENKLVGTEFYTDEAQGDPETPNWVAQVFEGDNDFPNPQGYGGYQAFTFTQNLFSQEIKATSTGDGPLNWVAGVYGFTEDNILDRGFFPTKLSLGLTPFSGPRNNAFALADLNREGYAVFGQINYKVTPDLELSAGARYQHEKSEIAEMTTSANFGDGGFLRGWSTTNPNFSTLYPGVPTSMKGSVITPMASITYQVSDALTTYATVGRGVKGGGFTRNPAIGSPLPAGISFEEEVATNYEIGAKADLFNSRLRLNIAAFRIDLEDMQVESFVPDGAGGFVVKTGNAAAATSKGFEAEFTALPVTGLVLAGSLAYTHATFDKYILNRGDNVAIDIAGERIESVPDWTAFLSADYTSNLTDDVDWNIGVEYSYIGDQIYGNGTYLTPFTPSPSQNWTNIRLGLETERWALTAYVNNLFDRYNVLQRKPTATSVFLRPDIAPAYERPSQPRVFGIRGSVKF